VTAVNNNYEQHAANDVGNANKYA